MDRFSQLLVSVLRDYPLSGGDNLAGFLIDLDCYSEKNPALSKVAIKETTDPENMILLSAEVAPSVSSLSDLQSALSMLWLDIAYSDIQASAIMTYHDRCVLRFVTAIEPAVLFVSGSFLVSGPRYAELAGDYERNWNRTLPFVEESG